MKISGLVNAAFLILFLYCSDLSARDCDNNDAQYPAYGIGPISADGVIDTTRSIAAERIVPGYFFEGRFDSVDVCFLLSGFRMGTRKLYLANWCLNRELRGLSDSTLSSLSRTVNFTLQAGGRLSFEREMYWFRAGTDYFDSSWYACAVGVQYRVELRDARSDTLLAVLDYVRLPARAGSSTLGDDLFGNSARIAVADYAIPAELHGQAAYLCICVATSGLPARTPPAFMRRDCQLVMAE